MGISTETLVCEDMTLCTDPSNSYYTVHGCLRVDKTCQLRQSVAMAIFKMAPYRRMK